MKKFGRQKPAPEGWSEIEPSIKEFEAKLREVENTPHEGKRINESTWPVFQIHHQRTRYIYDLYYERRAISRDLYEWCLEQGIADGLLIAKWKRAGYESLCCLRCIQGKDTNFGTQCICRVPKHQREDPDRTIECVHCGCRGCSGK